jgi:hypothetical protein
MTTADIKILDTSYHPRFKSHKFLYDCQDSAFNGKGEMGEFTQAGGIKIWGSTSVAVIEIACHKCVTICVEAKGGHFGTLF